jgi:hypothetical protein
LAPGRKGYSKVEKRFPRESSFPLFYPRDRKVEKDFPREISFPPLNILFFPGQYFSAGLGKQNCTPGQFSFHDTNKIVHQGDSLFMIQYYFRVPWISARKSFNLLEFAGMTSYPILVLELHATLLNIAVFRFFTAPPAPFKLAH